jgi:hypothetical protein
VRPRNTVIQLSKIDNAWDTAYEELMTPIIPNKVVILTTPTSEREIADRFLALPRHKREGILRSLGMIVRGNTDTERYIKAFRVLGNRIHTLDYEIKQAEKTP